MFIVSKGQMVQSLKKKNNFSDLVEELQGLTNLNYMYLFNGISLVWKPNF